MNKQFPIHQGMRRKNLITQICGELCARFFYAEYRESDPTVSDIPDSMGLRSMMSFRTRWQMILIVMMILCLTSCGYRADRYDEYVITQQSDHANLYQNLNTEGLQSLNRIGDRNVPDPAEKLLSGNLSDAGTGSNSYATIAIRFQRNPPLVNGYKNQCGTEQKELLFSVPLMQSNSLLLREEEHGIRVYQILLSLRYDTIFPILFKDNFELFLLTISHDTMRDEWTIREMNNVTKGKSDAFQGVFNAQGDQIAYVEGDRTNRTRLIVMKRDGSDRQIVSEDGLLPCFLDSGELLYVEQMALFREFKIYSPKNGRSRLASDDEISQQLRIMPYSALKEFYLRLEKKKQDRALFTELTFSQLFEYGLKNSPVVLQGYYEYLSIMARNTQNLYDLGPDFFMGADYLVTSSVFFNTPDDPYYVIGDRIGNDNFIRLMTGFSIPVIPNLPLRWAQRYHDDWKKCYGRATILKAINEYSGQLSRLAFDYWQKVEELNHVKRQLAINKKQIQRFENQISSGHGISERLMFARNIQAGLLSEQNAAAERLLQYQSNLLALTGMNLEKGFRLMPQFFLPEEYEFIHNVHRLDWFHAQGQINRQELRQIDALIQQDAATRDMGPERTRIDAVRVRISYGVGFLDWQRIVDDFLLMGVNYAVPLRLPIFFESYFKDYENRIMALRMRKYQMTGVIRDEILSNWVDYATENGRYTHRLQRLDTVREQARRAMLLQTLGSREIIPLENELDEYSAQMETIEEQRNGCISQYERLRRLASLYQAAGRSDFFLKQIVAVQNEKKNTQAYHQLVKTLGIYVWIAPDLIRSKKQREELLDQCLKAKINLVYCYVSMKQDRIPFLVKYEPEYEYFIEVCHRKGIKVMALLGEPSWVDPNRRSDLMILLDSWLKFNQKRQAEGGAGFDGISFDVEPHSDPGWNGVKRDQMISDFLNLFAEVSLIIPKEQINIAVPCLYSGTPVPNQRSDLLKKLTDYCGSITLMAYQNTEKKVIDRMVPILKRNDLKCKIYVAIETNPVNELGVSFFGIGRSDLFQILSNCAKVGSKYHSFSGMVIHDYTGFTQMR